VIRNFVSTLFLAVPLNSPGLPGRARVQSISQGIQQLQHGLTLTEGAKEPKKYSCRLSCRLTTTLSGIAKVEQRQITLSVNDLQICCRTSCFPSVA
jgi:hypothetical protein